MFEVCIIFSIRSVLIKKKLASKVCPVELLAFIFISKITNFMLTSYPTLLSIIKNEEIFASTIWIVHAFSYPYSLRLYVVVYMMNITYHPYTNNTFLPFITCELHTQQHNNIVILFSWYTRGNIFLRNCFHPSSYTFSFWCRFFSIICCANSLSSSTALSLEMFSVLKHGNEGKCFYVYADMQ